MKAFPILTIAGFVGLAIAFMLGFEKPNSLLVLVSTICLLAAPAAVVAHLATTGDLTRDEKRAWLRALTGRRALDAWSGYLMSDDRRDALNRIARPASPS